MKKCAKDSSFYQKIRKYDQDFFPFFEENVSKHENVI